MLCLYCKLFILLFAYGSASSSMAHPPPSAKNNSGTATVEQTLDAFHAAASRADGEAYFGLFSKNGYFIGTDATERWTVAEFRKYAMPFFAQGKGWTYRPRTRHVTHVAATAGNEQPQVAWFDEILDSDRFGVTRSSGVVVIEDDIWKVAQFHLTVPVPNDLMDEVVALIRNDAADDDDDVDFKFENNET